MPKIKRRHKPKRKFHHELVQTKFVKMLLRKRGLYPMNITEIIKNLDVDKDYTPTELAKLFDMSYTAVVNNLERDIIKSYRLFRRHYVRGKDLKEYLTDALGQ